MINIPAFCNSCGAVFPSGFAFENLTVSLSGNTTGPCPMCGGIGHIPDGVFNFIGNTINILNAPDTTIKELRTLSQILKSYQKKETNIEDMEHKIEKSVPEFKSILDLFPKTRQDLYSFIGIILTIITILISVSQNNNQPTKIETNQVINYIYQTNITKMNTGNEETIVNNINVNQEQIVGHKIGRNEKCPCGSNKKYKYCHGK